MNSNIEMLRGDANTAIKKLAVPVMLGMLLMMINNLVDSMWVAGLGSAALAGVGIIMPLFMIAVGVGNGLGAGANSLVSRMIGAKDKVRADNAAMHGIILTIVISAIITVVSVYFMPQIIAILGGASLMTYALPYGYIVIGGSIFMILTSVLGGIMRAEGDAKRPMYAMLVSMILNIILDPIFIYVAGWGVAGAAFATVLSSIISTLMVLYWVIIKQDTFIDLDIFDFSFDMSIIKDILAVSIPSSFESCITSLVAFITNYVLIIVGGTMAVAVYTVGWRLVMIGVIPMIGISTAASTITGIAFGAKQYDKIKEAMNFASKYAIKLCTVIGIAMAIFAPVIAQALTGGSPDITGDVTNFVRLMSLYVIGGAISAGTLSVFKGMGKGTWSLLLMFIKQLVFVGLFVVVAGLVLHLGMWGVFGAIILGNFVGAITSQLITSWYVDKL